MTGMRLLHPIVVLPLALGAGGCAEECVPPDFALNGKVWTVFNTVVEHTPPDLDPAYPGEESPANGAHTLAITWENSGLSSPLTVKMDGQEFRGQGEWDDGECGNFTLTWEGEYASADGSSTYDFSAGAALQTWEGHLEGVWNYGETWTAQVGRPAEASGRVEFVVQMVGTQ